MNTRRTTGWRVSGLALLGGSCALQAMPAASQQGADDAEANGVPAELTEVIVTAERRAQSVQKSSLSISVLDSQTLGRVTDAKDIATLVPGVTISQGASTLQTFVRGVGDFGSSALNQSAVSFNVNGAYVADTSTVSPQFFDLSRVEVLKGPQGTLYGRNSSAGSVNLIFKAPELGRFGGDALLEAGNHGNLRAGGALNVPVGEISAIRGAFNYAERDGYLSDGTNDEDVIAGRVQVLLQPGDAFSLNVAGDLSDRSGRGAGSVLIPRQSGNGRFTGNVNAANNAARLAVAPAAYTPGAGLPPTAPTGLLHDSFIDHQQYNIGAELNWDLGSADLTFIPYYRNSESSIGTYSSGSPFMNQEDIEQTSYELRLAHDAGWGSVIVGAYYLNLDQLTAAQVFTATFITADQIADLGTESIAGFGQATFNITDGARLIAGARYTTEDRSIDASDITNGVDFASDVTFKEWTWRAGLEYDVSANSMAYVNAGKGFKSGGFNIFAPTATVTNAYEPEELYSYSVGIRNRFLDNRLQLNIEGFYWDYRDSQQNALAFTPAGNLQFSTFNAASATLHGVDVDLAFRPTSRDTVTATLAYLRGEFDDFLLNTPFPTAPESNGCALDNTSPPFSIDCSGFQMPRAPRWSGNASYEHVFSLAGNDLAVRTRLDFASERLLGINYVSNEKVGGFVRFNAEATYSFGKAYSLTAFVDNLTNEEIPIVGNQAGLSPNLIYAQVAPPRTYGLRLLARF